MNRALWVWKLKLCLAALAAMMTLAVAPQRTAHETHPPQKDKSANVRMTADRHDEPKAPAPTPVRQPAPADSHDRLSAML